MPDQCNAATNPEVIKHDSGKPSNYHGHPAFYRIVEELKELHSEKSRQYATKDNPLGNFERTGKMISKFLKPGINPTLASCLALVSKQIDGVYELVGECKENTADSLEDKLRDIAVYAILAMIIVGETQGEKSPLVEIKEGRVDECYQPEPNDCLEKAAKTYAQNFRRNSTYAQNQGVARTDRPISNTGERMDSQLRTTTFGQLSGSSSRY